MRAIGAVLLSRRCCVGQDVGSARISVPSTLAANGNALLLFVVNRYRIRQALQAHAATTWAEALLRGPTLRVRAPWSARHRSMIPHGW
ncbi:MAG: hypothetical protein EOO27_46920 [Comamonadaceae bacterium]|nr:MAG: hypothetical protein EOO27_46920 [Comamonadaceae bacterium]